MGLGLLIASTISLAQVQEGRTVTIEQPLISMVTEDWRFQVRDGSLELTSVVLQTLTMHFSATAAVPCDRISCHAFRLGFFCGIDFSQAQMNDSDGVVHL